MAKVEVLSSCLVGNNFVSSIPRLELISWDLRLLPRTYIERGLVFQKPQQAVEDLMDGLKSSLSRTLEWFPTLAGQLSSSAAADGNLSRFFVDCNNAGAVFRHAVTAEVSVADILEAKYTPPVVYSLFPRDGGVHNIDGLSKPLLAVQVTELADGIFVACSANHCVVDGTSFWHFINSWAQISRGLDTISKPPVLDRRSCFPGINDDGLLVHVPTVERSLVPRPSLTVPHKVFRFSRETVGKLKAKANSEAGGGSHRISSLQAVVAHLWRSIERCRRSGAQAQEALMVLVVGARARMGPTLPENYFGNAVFATMLSIQVDELVGEKGLGYAALKINEVVSQQTNDVARREAEKKVEFPATQHSGDHPPLVIGSSPRHDVYGNDFGWGKPVGVRSGESMQRERVVLLLPTPEAGGIDVELCLPQETLEAMESDADFLAPLITN